MECFLAENDANKKSPAGRTTFVCAKNPTNIFFFLRLELVFDFPEVCLLATENKQKKNAQKIVYFWTSQFVIFKFRLPHQISRPVSLLFFFVFFFRFVCSHTSEFIPTNEIHLNLYLFFLTKKPFCHTLKFRFWLTRWRSPCVHTINNNNNWASNGLNGQTKETSLLKCLPRVKRMRANNFVCEIIFVFLISVFGQWICSMSHSFLNYSLLRTTAFPYIYSSDCCRYMHSRVTNSLCLCVCWLHNNISETFTKCTCPSVRTLCIELCNSWSEKNRNRKMWECEWAQSVYSVHGHDVRTDRHDHGDIWSSLRYDVQTYIKTWNQTLHGSIMIYRTIIITSHHVSTRDTNSLAEFNWLIHLLPTSYIFHGNDIESKNRLLTTNAMPLVWKCYLNLEFLTVHIPHTHTIRISFSYIKMYYNSIASNYTLKPSTEQNTSNIYNNNKCVQISTYICDQNEK